MIIQIVLFLLMHHSLLSSPRLVLYLQETLKISGIFLNMISSSIYIYIYIILSTNNNACMRKWILFRLHYSPLNIRCFGSIFVNRTLFLVLLNLPCYSRFIDLINRKKKKGNHVTSLLRDSRVEQHHTLKRKLSKFITSDEETVPMSHRPWRSYRLKEQ